MRQRTLWTLGTLRWTASPVLTVSLWVSDGIEGQIRSFLHIVGDWPQIHNGFLPVSALV